MTPEELIGRVQALEWLISTLVADAIAQAPVPHDAAEQFRAVCVQQARGLTDLARAQGEAGGGCQTAAFADALLDLGQTIIHGSVAASVVAGEASH